VRTRTWALALVIDDPSKITFPTSTGSQRSRTSLSMTNAPTVSTSGAAPWRAGAARRRKVILLGRSPLCRATVSSDHRSTFREPHVSGGLGVPAGGQANSASSTRAYRGEQVVPVATTTTLRLNGFRHEPSTENELIGAIDMRHFRIRVKRAMGSMAGRQGPEGSLVSRWCEPAWRSELRAGRSTTASPSAA
jgi:hypothetical protein